MKRAVLVAIAVVLSAGFSRLGASRAGTNDLTLFDGLRGAWLATLRFDAPLIVVEEREGWRRVRIEGWIPGTSAPASGTAQPGTDAPPRSAAGVTVRGVLLPPDDGRGAAGPGLIVLLLSDIEAFDREHAGAGETCRSRLQESADRITELRAEFDKALSSSDNFRQAAQTSDRLKARLREAEKERADRLLDCRRAADAIVERHTVKRVVSDARGGFELDSVPPGRYRLAASETAGGSPRAWLFDCLVGGDPIVVDPLRDRAPVDLYWGLFGPVKS